MAASGAAGPRVVLQQPAGRLACCVDWMLLGLFLLPSTLGLVLYGSVRLWLTGPLIVAVCLAGLVMCLRVCCRRGAATLALPPGTLGLVALGGYILATAWRASVPFEAMLEAVRLGSYIAAYLGICLLAGPGRRWRVPVAILLILTSLQAWYAIVQDVNGSNWVLYQQRPEQYGMRASGTFVCPNHLANLLQIVVVFGVAVLFIRRSGWFLRIVALYAVAVSLPVLLMTESRSAWIGTAVGLTTLAVLAALRTSWKRAVAAGMAMLLLVAAAGLGLWYGSATFRKRVEEALRGNVRIQLWQDTLEAAADQPLWGHGPGSFRWIYAGYKDQLRGPTVPRYTHNEYLQLAAEYGAAGALIVAVTVLIYAGPLVRAVRTTASNREGMLTAGWLAALAGTAAHAVFDFNLHIFALVHVLVMLSATVTGRLYQEGALPVRCISRPAARGLAVAAAGALALMAVWTSRATASYVLADATASLRQDVRRLEDAETMAGYAMRVDPGYWRAHEEHGATLKTRALWYFDPAGKDQLARRAVSAYEQTLALNPLRRHARVSLSRIHRDLLDQPERGLEIVRELVEEAPRVGAYRLELGIHLRRLGRLEEALEALREARKLDWRDPAIPREIQRVRRRISKASAPYPPGQQKSPAHWFSDPLPPAPASPPPLAPRYPGPEARTGRARGKPAGRPRGRRAQRRD